MCSIPFTPPRKGIEVCSIPFTPRRNGIEVTSSPNGKAGGQPLTAPAVRPDAMFFWISRKKMTTGSEVIMAPAIRGPQNV